MPPRDTRRRWISRVAIGSMLSCLLLPSSAHAQSDGAPEASLTVRARRESGAATTESFRGEELTSLPGTFGDPLRIVAALPGVARSPFQLGFFLVRGASFENTGLLVDGFPVPNLYHFGAGPAVIAPRFVGGLDFYPGGYPLSYGRFSAGLVSVETRPPVSDRPHIEAELDVLRAGAFVSVPFDHRRGTVAIAARRSYFEPFLALFSPGLQFGYGDFQGRIDYRFSDRLRGSLFTFFSYDLLDQTSATNVRGVTEVARQALEYRFWRAIGRLEWRVAPGVQVQLSTMVGHDRLFARQVEGNNDASVTVSGAALGERLSVRIEVNRTLSLHTGIDALGYLYNIERTRVGDQRVDVLGRDDLLEAASGLTQASVGAFFEARLREGPVELTFGPRIDHARYQRINATYPEARATVRIRAHEALSVIAATGTFHQTPQVLLLVFQPDAANAPPQAAWQSSLGIEARLPLSIELRTTGFYTAFDGLPGSGGFIRSGESPRNRLAPLGPDGRDTFSVQGRAYGLELMVRRRLERGLYGWISYTVSRSERFYQSNTPVAFNYDQTHVLNLAVSYRPHPRWRLGGRFSFASGRPVRNVIGSIYNPDGDTYTRWTDTDADRGPLTHQLDIRIDHFFQRGPIQFSAYLDVINAYYAQNSEVGWEYSADYFTRVPGPGIPILPTIGIRGEW